MKTTLDKDKLYYSIGEVSDLFGVSNSLVRYWESEFKQLKPQKNRRGDRKYTKKDIQVLETIYHLVKEEGYTIEGAKKVLGKALTSRRKEEELIAKLERIKKGLLKIKDRLS